MSTGFSDPTGTKNMPGGIQSTEFERRSITVDKGALDRSNSTTTTIRKNIVLLENPDRSGYFIPLQTENVGGSGSNSSNLRTAVVLAEQVSVSGGNDEPAVAYFSGTFNQADLLYNFKSTSALGNADWDQIQRIRVVR